MSFTLASPLRGTAARGARHRRRADDRPRTIEDRDSDNLLEYAPGEPHVVRPDLAPASPSRRRTREERLLFAQMTDTHVVDEESPLRVEFLDQVGPPFSSAYRPQERLTTQVLDAMVRQVRNGAARPSGTTW